MPGTTITALDDTIPIAAGDDISWLDRFNEGTDSLSAKLAHDLACGLSDTDVIMRRYRLTAAQLRKLLENPNFVGMVKEAQAKWQSDMSVTDRIKLKSAIALEDTILTVFKTANSENVPVAERNKAAQILHELSGLRVTGRNGEGLETQKFSLTINIGKDKVELKDVTPAIPAP